MENGIFVSKLLKEQIAFLFAQMENQAVTTS